MSYIYLCGVRIDKLTAKEAVERALYGEERPCWVVTPNAVMLDACNRNAKNAELLNHASLSVADGIGVTIAARRQGTPLAERIAGIAFGEALMERAAKEGLRLFLLGGRAGVAERAAKRLRKRYDGLNICGVHDGFFPKSGEDDRRVSSLICACRPDILFVCFGFPLQERWIFEHLSLFPSIRAIAGLGGALDVWSGNLRRAPKSVSDMGMEWAWRILREPRRLKNLPALCRVWLFRG